MGLPIARPKRTPDRISTVSLSNLLACAASVAALPPLELGVDGFREHGQSGGNALYNRRQRGAM